MSRKKGASPRRATRRGGKKLTLPGIVLASVLLILTICYEAGLFSFSDDPELPDSPETPQGDSVISSEQDENAALAGDASGLKLHMVDVGQGLGMLLQCDGESAVYDTGTASAAEDFASYVLENAPDGVNFVFLSHPHQDHCGGAKELFSSVEAETLVISDCGDREAALLQAGEWLGASSASIDFTETGREYTLGGAEITVLHPDTSFESDNYNEWSLVLQVEYAGKTLLLTGDQEQKVEKTLIPLERVDVLQVGHHGSNTSSGQAFLENIAPDVALISVGADNSYGHPHQKALQRLRETGAEIYRTDLNGNILVEITPSGTVSVKTEKD